MISSFVQNLVNIARDVYAVDPAIFLIIYIIMTPTYYIGWFLVGKDALKYRKECKTKKCVFSFHDLLLRNGFLRGYVINRISWVAPYVYVIFWGENLPVRFYLILFGWVGISMYIFMHNIRKKYMLTEMGASCE